MAHRVYGYRVDLNDLIIWIFHRTIVNQVLWDNGTFNGDSSFLRRIFIRHLLNYYFFYGYMVDHR